MRSILPMWNGFSRSTQGRYSIALIAITIALLFRKLLDPVLGDHTPHITLYPTIVLLAMYVGLGPSVVSVIAGLAAATYWFVQPRGSFHVNDAPPHVFASLSFLAASACFITVGEFSRR